MLRRNQADAARRRARSYNGSSDPDALDNSSTDDSNGRSGSSGSTPIAADNPPLISDDIA